MKPLQIVGNAVIRYGVMLVLGWLINHKIIQADALSAGDIAQLVAFIAGGAAVLGWAVYTRLRAHFEKLVALKLPKNATESDVKAVVSETPVSTIMAASPSAASAAVNVAKGAMILFSAIALIGCQYSAATKRYELKPAVKADLQVALKQLGQHAVTIAQNTVASFATSEMDALVKNNFVQSSGDLLRTLENSAITAGSAEIAPTVEQQLTEWLPDKSHWQNYASQISVLIGQFAQQHPNDPAALNAALEEVATYLNTTTVVLQSVVYPSPSPSPTPATTPTPTPTPSA